MAYTQAQIDFITANSGTMGSARMGQAIGLTKAQVRHIRNTLGLLSSEPPPRAYTLWTEERRDAAHQMYVVEGRTAAETAEQFGVTAVNIRRLAHTHGWKRDPQVGVRNRTAKKPRAQASGAIPADLVATRFMHGSDAELVADFLARSQVTVCAPGYACGLMQIEILVHAANPARKTIAQRKLDARARRRAAA